MKANAKRLKNRFVNQLTALAVLLLLAAGSWVWEQIAPSESYEASASGASLIQFDVIDVAQGSSTLIRTSDKKVLIDGGEVDNTEMLKKYLIDNNITKLDTVVATHLHTDHYGGLLWVLDNMEVGEFILPATEESLMPTNSTFNKLLAALEDNGCVVTLQDEIREFDLGSAKMNLLGPFLKGVDDLNNTSLCFRIDAGEASFLITGDGETVVEDALRENHDIDIDVLVAGHHGSSTSSRPKFVSAASPKVSVISVGAENKYGHPTQKTIQTLESFGPIFRTDLHQTVSFFTDGVTITCKTQSGETYEFDARG